MILEAAETADGDGEASVTEEDADEAIDDDDDDAVLRAEMEVGLEEVVAPTTPGEEEVAGWDEAPEMPERAPTRSGAAGEARPPVEEATPLGGRG